MRSSVGIRVLLGLEVSCLALVLAFARVPGAHAEVSVCYTDPVVVLSNGNTLDLSDTIGDNYLDVQQIVYTLHAPAGTSVANVIYTSGPIGPKESLRFYADQPAGQYATTSAPSYGTRTACTGVSKRFACCRYASRALS